MYLYDVVSYSDSTDVYVYDMDIDVRNEIVDATDITDVVYPVERSMISTDSLDEFIRNMPEQCKVPADFGDENSEESVFWF
jgi:hypothetical protein